MTYSLWDRYDPGQISSIRVMKHSISPSYRQSIPLILR